MSVCGCAELIGDSAKAAVERVAVSESEFNRDTSMGGEMYFNAYSPFLAGLLGN